MAEERRGETVLRFGWEHLGHEGRYVNLSDALKQIGAQQVCLAPLDEPYGAAPAEAAAIAARLERTGQVAAKLGREGIAAELALPSLTWLNPSLPASRKQLRAVYAGLGRLRIKRLWVDDAAGQWHRGFDGAGLCQWLRRIGRQVRKQRPRLEVGLIGATPGQYARLGVTGMACAAALAGQRPALLAVGQGFRTDERRTDILEAAEAIATARAQAGPEARLWGVLDHGWPATFAKSTEAVHMQVNVNLLHGVSGFMNGCADPLGMALRERDRHLVMLNHCRPFWRRLARLLGEQPRGLGIAAVVPTGRGRGRRWEGPGGNPWIGLLWRFGLPVTCVAPGGVGEHKGPFAVAGRTIEQLSRRELAHVFEQGVALDAAALGCLEEAGVNQLAGMRRRGPLRDVQEEMLSDQTFALRYYGNRTMLAGQVEECYGLEGLEEGVRAVTTLRRRGRLPITPGAAVFDDPGQNRRCLVLPYELTGSEGATLLTTARQVQFHDLFGWLGRARLACRVQEAADLAPFLSATGRKRAVLALLNVGFDWAIDTRVQLGRLGFEPRRVRVLEEQGALVEYADVRVMRRRDYAYVQLTAETAVAPMQMAVLVLEG